MTLQRTNCDRRVDATPAACVFAWRRADAATDRREGIRGARDEVGVFSASLGNQLNVAPSIGLYRTPVLALDLRLPVGEPRQANGNGHAASRVTLVR